MAVSTALLGGMADAAPDDPKHTRHGHFHIDKELKAKGEKKVRLDRACKVLVRPHHYEDELDRPDGTVTAAGRKPTPSTGPLLLTNTSTAAQGLALPQVVGAPVVYDLAPGITAQGITPHGKITTDKHGKVHNTLHWHVTVSVENELGQLKKKNLKLWNCNPAFGEASEDASAELGADEPGDEQDGPDLPDEVEDGGGNGSGNVNH
jgi:hypothetical protein